MPKMQTPASKQLPHFDTVQNRPNSCALTPCYFVLARAKNVRIPGSITPFVRQTITPERSHYAHQGMASISMRKARLMSRTEKRTRARLTGHFVPTTHGTGRNENAAKNMLLRLIGAQWLFLPFKNTFFYRLAAPGFVKIAAFSTCFHCDLRIPSQPPSATALTSVRLMTHLLRLPPAWLGFFP
jgi:hypothetical protein